MGYLAVLARKPRNHFPEGLYHVLLRGNGGQRIYFDEEDDYRFSLLTQEGVERYGYRVHGFFCMTHPLSLAIQVAEVPLSKIVQNLSFCYTRWINRKPKRVGHLFQSRDKAIPVARGVGAWLAKLGSGSLREIEERFGRDGSAMSVAIRRIEHRARELRGFHRPLERLKEYKYSTFQAWPHFDTPVMPV